MNSMAGSPTGRRDEQADGPASGDGRVFSYAFGEDGFIASDFGAVKWVWTHFALADNRARRSIEMHPALPENVREGLVAAHGSPHFDFEDPWLHGEIVATRYEHDASVPEVGHFRFAACRDLLISCRRRPLRAVEEARQLVEARKRPFPNPASLVEAVMTRALDQLVGETATLAGMLDSVEDRVIAGGWHSEREKLPEIRRRIVYIHRHAATVTNIFRHVESVHHAELPPDLSDTVTRLSHHAMLLLHDTEQLQARARLLQDELMARLSDRSNRLLYLLSVMTAVLLPMTVISGLLGMNVGGLPLSRNPLGFWEIVLISGAVAAFVLFLVRRYGGEP